MRRVFTHLTSGWQTGPFIHGEKRFSGRPGFVPLWSRTATKQQQKFLAHTARGSRGISFYFLFFILLYYIYLIKHLIQFRSLYFLHTPASSAHASLRQMRCWSSSKKIKKDKKSNKSEENPENRKKVLVDPGRHFPVPY